MCVCFRNHFGSSPFSSIAPLRASGMESWMVVLGTSDHFVTIMFMVIAVAPFSASLTNSATVLLAEFFVFVLCK